MSALASALAAYRDQHPTSVDATRDAHVVAPTPHSDDNDNDDSAHSPTASSSAFVLSASPSCSSLSSSRSSCSDASIASTSSAPEPRLRAHSLPRPNEHLAVLLPKHLWKADSSASHCDNFYCRVPFSLFDRRHHCRKCGGVFCHACSSRSTPLLDTSKLDFLHPPRNTPLTAFESPSSPIIESRVCDDCFDQIHGCRTPEPEQIPVSHRPRRTRSLLSSPISLFKSPLILSTMSATTSPTPSMPSSPAALDKPSVLPPAPLTRTKRGYSRPASPRSLRLTHSASLPPSSSQFASSSPSSSSSSDSAAGAPSLERSYGELDAYPLRRASLLCKASGGGRWSPKPEFVDPGARVPLIGAKALYELDLEREEEEARRRRSNPVIRDGEFVYRFQVVIPDKEEEGESY